MQVIGHDIGDVLDKLYAEIEGRVRVEAERELRVEAFEGGGTSNVRWEEDAVVVQLHSGVPTHALPHIFGVALQHVRQRLDRYPEVRRPPALKQGDGAGIVRAALRELVLAPEADMQLESLALDQEWEIEQRHQGLKELLRDPPPDGDEEGSPGNSFIALQYARFAIQHPPEMWDGLRTDIKEAFPAATARGKRVVSAVRESGWGTPGACLQSLLGAREELALRSVALIYDRRTGESL